MLYATLGGLMWPAITRLLFVAPHLPRMFGLLAVLVFAPAVRDLWLRAETRWLTLALAIGVLATLPARAMAGQTQAWHTVAAWLIR